MQLKIAMRVWNIVLSAGVIMSSLGIIFHFQGKSVIGPPTSFMYANPDWVLYGIEIMVIGIVTIGASIIMQLIQRKKPKN